MSGKDPLLWARIDVALPRNPKVLAMISRDPDARAAAFVYIAAILYCKEHGTDGHIPEYALPFIHGTDKDAAILTSAQLWKEVRNGWFMIDYADYNGLAQATAETLARKRVGALKGNCQRWHGDDCGCWKVAPG